MNKQTEKFENIELLEQLYCIHSMSGREQKMMRFIKNQVKQIKNTECWFDEVGNMYVQKGNAETFPCVACHTDQVQQMHPKDFRLIKTGDLIFGWSDKKKAMCGLGADDKNGIFIALNCLKKFDSIKVAFFVGEEVGCVGSSQCDLEFFDDCRFVIEPDRKGSSDLITTMGATPVCSQEFINDIPYKQFGYKEEVGSMTDVLMLIEDNIGVSGLNLSCGYYHPHTDEEVTSLSDLYNCQNLVFEIIGKCTKVYPFTYEYLPKGNVWYSDYGKDKHWYNTDPFSYADGDEYCTDSICYNKREEDLFKQFLSDKYGVDFDKDLLYNDNEYTEFIRDWYSY